jgi:hypothetical protein
MLQMRGGGGGEAPKSERYVTVHGGDRTTVVSLLQL